MWVDGQHIANLPRFVGWQSLKEEECYFAVSSGGHEEEELFVMEIVCSNNSETGFRGG